MFASHTQSNPIPVPFDSKHAVTVRKLTGTEIERAQSVAAAMVIRGRGFADRIKRLSEAKAPDAKVLDALADPLNSYDRGELIKAGLVAWTYKQADGTPKPIDDTTRADLDDEGMEFIATEVLRLTKPGLFKSDDQLRADRKNDSSGSTKA